MAQNKHLHELLREDQEPFLLKEYMADKRHQFKSPFPKTQIQLRKRKPISDHKPHNFCKSACFFSFHDSPDLTKSPLFPKSPCKNPNPIFFHIPSRTATVLLEAAARIQRPRTREVKSRLGIFGSVLKKLTHRSRNKKREIDGVRVPSVGTSSSGKGFSCSCDLDPSSSCSDTIERLNGIFDSSEKGFCESPFRFVLQRSPSSGRRTPELSSPAASPTRRSGEENENYEQKSPNKFGAAEEEEEEDKEQCSPVSVLDPPFNDDEDANEDSFDLECSYAIVQRTKKQLLQKLCRFEKLAGLDPVDLEKTMKEVEEDEDEDENEEDNDSHSLDHYDFYKEFCIPVDMKRLVLDLIEEERGEPHSSGEYDAVAKRVGNRLEGWKEVESNTIDMMVETDFRSETNGWKRNEQQVGNVAMEIERAIFGLLVKELSEEIPHFCG